MFDSLMQRLEGTLAHYAEEVDRLRDTFSEPRIQVGVRRMVKGAVEYTMGPQPGTRQPGRGAAAAREGCLG